MRATRLAKAPNGAPVGLLSEECSLELLHGDGVHERDGGDKGGVLRTKRPDHGHAGKVIIQVLKSVVLGSESLDVLHGLLNPGGDKGE